MGICPSKHLTQSYIRKYQSQSLLHPVIPTCIGSLNILLLKGTLFQLSTLNSIELVQPVTRNCCSNVLETLKFGFITDYDLITENNLDTLGSCETWLNHFSDVE